MADTVSARLVTQRNGLLPDIAISTTDSRGTITAGNSAFVRNSGYEVRELAGAAHSLLRHPDMPRGLFTLMWERLSSGRPFVGYVKNRSKTGVATWNFVVITPLPDGYISLMLDARAALVDTVGAIYHHVSEYERGVIAHRGGLDAGVGEAGARLLERRLAEVGYPQYEDFVLAALPTEIGVRGLDGQEFHDSAVGALGEIVDTAHNINNLVEAMVRKTGDYHQAGELLTPTARCVTESIDRMHCTTMSINEASHFVANQAPVLKNVAAAINSPMHDATSALAHVGPRMQALRSEIQQLGFHIALSRLQAAALTGFAAEHASHHVPPALMGTLYQLCEILADGIEQLACDVSAVNANMLEVAAQMHQTVTAVTDFRHFVGQWRLLATRRRQTNAIAVHTEHVDGELDALTELIERLHATASRCQRVVEPFDSQAVEFLLRRLRTCAVTV